MTLWTQIIAQVKPLGTRALLQQQGHLISYDGQAARVGIKSDKLLKMAQSKLPNIEAAFQQLLSQPVKVSLEVAAPSTDGPPAAGSPPPAPPATTSSAPTPSPQPSADAPAPRPPAPPPTASEPPASFTDTDTASASSAEPPWQAESDIDRAVKSFAEFFNGQIVDLSDDEAADNNGSSSPPKSDSSKPSASPGSDVPF